VSPDGRTVYEAIYINQTEADVLLVFRRGDRGPYSTVPPGAGNPIRAPGIGGIGMVRGRFSFSLDNAATVTITLNRALRGRMVRGRCVAQTRANSRRRTCTRLKKAGRLVVSGKAGDNSVALPKSLGSGSYRATVVAVADGKASLPKTKSFRLP
jgi:hypothetical protein